MDKEVLNIVFDERVRLKKVFGHKKKLSSYLCPGSVVMMGNHTHYNNGPIISAALNKYIFLTYALNNSGKVRAIDETTSLPVEMENYQTGSNLFLDCLKHVLNVFASENIKISGFDCAFNTNIPANLGLGSVPSIMVSIVKAINKSNNLKLGKLGKVRLSYMADCEMRGKVANKALHCTAVLSDKNKFLLLDPLEEKPNFFTIPPERYSALVISNNSVVINQQEICKQKISETYHGLKGLKLYIWGASSIRNLSKEFLLKHSYAIPKRLYERCLFNVEEIERTLNSAKVLRKSNLEAFGKLVTESHFGLSEKLAISNEVIDGIVNSIKDIPGVLGSKIICCSTIPAVFSIIEESRKEQIIDSAKEMLGKNKDLSYEFHLLNFSDGIKKIPEKFFA